LKTTAKKSLIRSIQYQQTTIRLTEDTGSNDLDLFLDLFPYNNNDNEVRKAFCLKRNNQMNMGDHTDRLL
jgi:hypothetical protein